MVARRAAREKWRFETRFRRGALGWRGTATGVQHLKEAVTEIARVARQDPIRAAEGAVHLIGRVSPAFANVDSSSGSLGAAVNRTIERLVPIVATPAADDTLRAGWLDRLWAAYADDDMGYLDSVGDRWGDFCTSVAMASGWADRLLPGLRASFAQPRGSGSYFHGKLACLSALLKAERHAELLGVLESAQFAWWPQRRFGFAALVAQGRRADALRYAEASREGTHNADFAIARACEELLLQSGRADEAYARYAIEASGYESTYLARFRALAKRYPTKDPAVLLSDLVTATPGSEGKWFAAAKSAGLFESAIALANASPTDPKTLTRAARDFIADQPTFAMEAALAALRWFGAGYGFDVTSLDVIEAYDCGARAAKQLEQSAAFAARTRETLAGADRFVRDALRLRLADSKP